MKQTICDLCGHLVEDKEKTANMILTAETGTMFFDLLNSTISRDSYDICPKCYKEIMTKINNVRKFGPKE